MKHCFLLLLLAGISLTLFAQNDPVKGKGLGVHFSLYDFHTAAGIRAQGLTRTLSNKEFFRLRDMKPGITISYIEGLGPHTDFFASLGVASLSYPVSGEESVGDKFYSDVTAQVNFKLLKDNYVVVPYVQTGVGGGVYNGGFSAFIPAGVGLQVKLFRRAFLMLNSQYRIAVTEKASYHFQNNVGLIGIISGREEPAAPVIPVPVVADRDGDGVPDADDRCPDEAGLSALKGCPDRDGDGVADIDDKCPDQKGVAKYDGCPVPDTDGDGINDEEDKCPQVPGVARYGGCPIPDSDGDGVNDEEDKCPNQPGPASNRGCPEIEKVVVDKVNRAAENVFFATGSAKLLSRSFTSLDHVVDVMKENPSFHVDISGHTDNTGGTELNQALSESRAASVKEYLLGKGIDASRITARGFGESNPVADNSTATGRQKNRRVEMKLRNY